VVSETDPHGRNLGFLDPLICLFALLKSFIRLISCLALTRRTHFGVVQRETELVHGFTVK
jgi:NADH:ubiquinone oxidoreductase subunit H